MPRRICSVASIGAGSRSAGPHLRPRAALDEMTFTVEPGSVTGFLGPTPARRRPCGRSSARRPRCRRVRWQGRPIDHEARRTSATCRGARPVPVDEGPRAAASSASCAASAARRQTREASGWLAQLPHRSRRRPARGPLPRLPAACAADRRRCCTGPTLLVLDEPFSGLDPVAVDALSKCSSARRRAWRHGALLEPPARPRRGPVRAAVVVDHGRVVAAGTIDDRPPSATRSRDRRADGSSGIWTAAMWVGHLRHQRQQASWSTSGAGWPDEERAQPPYVPDTLQVIFSASKGVTAVLFHVLCEQGVMAADVPVATYWPEFAVNGKEGITLRQVLSHQAGLPAVHEKLRAARRPGLGSGRRRVGQAGAGLGARHRPRVPPVHRRLDRRRVDASGDRQECRGPPAGERRRGPRSRGLDRPARGRGRPRRTAASVSSAEGHGRQRTADGTCSGAQRSLGRHRGTSDRRAGPLDVVAILSAALGLSARETDVVVEVLRGSSTKAIATALHLSSYTVRTTSTRSSRRPVSTAGESSSRRVLRHLRAAAGRPVARPSSPNLRAAEIT